LLDTPPPLLLLLLENPARGKREKESVRIHVVQYTLPSESFLSALQPNAAACICMGLGINAFYSTLRTLSSTERQEACRVTSATFPALLTMKTFMACDTWRPVSTAVFNTSQLWNKNGIW